MSQTKTDYSDYLLRQQRAKDIETARVRGWAYFLGAYLTGPIFPGIVAARTSNWTPFWVGLAAGVISLPFAAIDLGLVSSIPAAGIGTAMASAKAQEKRRALNVVSPEEADLLRFRDFDGK